MKILVTGGAGFIGSHLCERLSQGRHEVHVLDDLSSGKLSNLENIEVHFYQQSITDLEFCDQLFLDKKFDCVYHLAAIASVAACEDDPCGTHRVNMTASMALMDMAVKYKVSKFIFASSAAVYGQDAELPKNETSPIAPISFYGTDKYSAENTLMCFSKQNKIDGIAFRFFNVYGPRQDPSSPYSGVLSIFMNRILTQKNPSLNVFGDGKQTRDFIFVTDIVNALVLALNNKQMVSEVFNMGTGNGVSLLEIISELEELSQKKISIEFFPARSGDIKHSYCNPQKAINMGVKIDDNFKSGLLKLYSS